MKRGFMLMLVFAGACSKSAAPAPAPQPEPAPNASCEVACKESGATFERTDGDKCVCAKEETPEAAMARPCTAANCAAACAPNTCVGWRSNSTGGCNYACILTQAPIRTW